METKLVGFGDKIHGCLSFAGLCGEFDGLIWSFWGIGLEKCQISST